MIEIVAPGAYTTIQDMGRRGYMRFGVSGCGAMDKLALALANIIAGNARDEAALEATLMTPALRFLDDTAFAITGGRCEAKLDGASIPMDTLIAARAGQTLSSAAVTRGCRAYIAFAGGIACESALGSRSSDRRALIGGLGRGGKLKTGDVIPNAAPQHIFALAGRRLPEAYSDYIPHDGTATLRVMRGPQADALSPAGWETLASSEYTVAPESDRMGTRFSGAKLEFAPGHDGNIITDAVLPGAVQTPPSGLPILMNADAQTTGGYAKPAWVIGADMPKAAQLRPGDRVRFALCAQYEAASALADMRALEDRLGRAHGTRRMRVNTKGITYEISVTEAFPY